MLLRTIAFLAAFIANAAMAAADEPLRPEQAFKVGVSRSVSGGLRFDWDIAPGYYLYRERIEAAGPTAAVPLLTEQGIRKNDMNFGDTEVYFGHAAAVAEQPGSAPFELSYQGCKDESICYPSMTVTVDPATAQIVEKTSAAAASGGASTFELADDPSAVGSLLADGGRAWAVASFFAFGLLLAFTPCVFPMYPILAGILARQGESFAPARGFLLSSAYAVGLSSAFALAGAAAGWSGANLQFALQSPIVTGLLAAAFAVLAASMFGLFEIGLPSAWTSWVSRKSAKRRGGMGAAAIIGFTSALVVGPCVTAPLAGALLYVVQSGDVALGAAALFALGIGKSLPLVILGTVGSGMLPRAGGWMESVKKLFGFAFLLAAVWTADALLPPGASLGLYGAVLLGLAVFLIGPHKDRKAAFAATLAGALSGACGATLMVGGATGATDPMRPFSGLTEGAGRTTAKLAFTEAENAASVKSILADEALKQPVMVYFTADWCAECAKVERSVLPYGSAAASLAGIRLLKADLSDYDGAKAELMKQMRVAGPPTMVFFGKDGSEVPGTRLVGNVTAQTLENSAQKAKGLPRW